jgi:hypothetical protein
MANAADARFADLPGIWQMHGYGRVFDISAERLVSYDITEGAHGLRFRRAPHA